MTITINDALAKRVRQVKQDTGQFTIKRGFASWLAYIRKESNTLYFNNLER